MRRAVTLFSVCALLTAVAAGPAFAPAALAATPGSATTPSPGSLVSAVPASWTPDVVTQSGDLSTAVDAITQVGDEMVVGGNFTEGIQPHGSTSTLPLNYVFAVSNPAGTVSTAFAPALNNAVNALLPGPEAGTVYVGGDFTSVDGTTMRHLALLNLSTGQPVAGFRVPAFNGAVNALAMADGGSELLVGGTFTLAGSAPAAGIVSLNPETGAVTQYVPTAAGFGVNTNHNWYPGCSGCAKAGVGVTQLAVSPDGTRLVMIGNFNDVAGPAGNQQREQVALVDLSSSGAVLDPNWNTDLYDAPCYTWAFDSYIRDVQFSPDGSYFAITATGGGGQTQPNTEGCDSVARFNTDDTGSNVAPAWVDYTGNDTVWGLAVSSDAIYVGGHERWFNNANGIDSPGAGSVPRPGLGALDPVNGLPFTWNPGRHPRGNCVYALFLDSSGGLWVGSDTDWIGNYTYRRDRLAYFPAAGGMTLPATTVPTLPGNVYMGGQNGADSLAVRSLDPANDSVGPTSQVTGTSIPWSEVHGAFEVNGELYYLCDPTRVACDAAGDPEGLYVASFNGSSFGPPSYVQPFNNPTWDNVQTGSGQTYQGQPPPLYALTSQVTGMTYAAGQLYYTLSGSSTLYQAAFEPQSGVVGATAFPVQSSVSFNGTEGLFTSGGELYWATGNGALESAAFTGGTVTGPANVVDSTQDWAGQAVFLGPQTPTAAFTASCSDQTCRFDGTPSTDPDASIQTWSWSFGDGTSATGETVSHTFPAAGSYPVTLTVTDSLGASATTSQTVPVSATPRATVTFRAAATSDTQTADPAVTVPAGVEAGDTLVAFLTVNSATVSVSGPQGSAGTGWTELGSEPVSGMQSLVFTKTAATGDAGGQLKFSLGSAAKADLQLLAYTVSQSGVAWSPQAAAATDAGSTSHTTPSVTTLPGDQVISYWSAKSAGPISWKAPSGQTVEASAVPASGSGLISSVAADAGSAGVAGHTGGGLTATTTAAVTRAVEWSVVLGSS